MTNPFADPAGADIVVLAPRWSHRVPLPPGPGLPAEVQPPPASTSSPDVEGTWDRGYTRVTTGAQDPGRHRRSGRWKLRSVVRGSGHPHLLEDIDLYADPWEVSRDLERAADKPMGRRWRQGPEFGTAIHAWCEGRGAGSRPVLRCPARVRAVRGGVFLGAGQVGDLGPLDPTGRPYVERIVYNPIPAGWDVRQPLSTGRWIGGHRGQRKRPRTWPTRTLAISIQLGDYAGASHILSLDGTRWEPMPEVRPSRWSSTSRSGTRRQGRGRDHLNWTPDAWP